MTGMALAHCILDKFLGVVCHCFSPPLDVRNFADRCLYVRKDARDPSSERWNCGREIFPVILPKFRLPHKFRDLLHAANLRHGTDGFTCPPKEGVLRIFSVGAYQVKKKVMVQGTLCTCCTYWYYQHQFAL